MTNYRNGMTSKELIYDCGKCNTLHELAMMLAEWNNNLLWLDKTQQGKAIQAAYTLATMYEINNL